MHMMARPYSIDSCGGFLLGIVIIILVLWAIVADDVRNRVSFWTRSSSKFPDFSHYENFTHTLSNEQFPTYDKDRRIIVIGDLHGMNASLTTLLNRISYDARRDILIHLGDLATKAPVEDSLAVLSFMESNKILGVRGNNDQEVLEWRAWMDWIVSQPGGRKWLRHVDKHWSDYEPASEKGDISAFNPWRPLMKKPDWGDKVPKGWRPLGDHYQVARAMSRSQYEYLRSLPLVLYAPAGHVFFVHAGLLAADPRRRSTHHKQPLSHWPSIQQRKHDIPAIRKAQELALLSEIPQNQDPWTVQNIRSVLKNGKLTPSSHKGTPFSDLWNEIMGRCSGFHDSNAQFDSVTRLTGYQESQLVHLPCYPSTVVYGHAAGRGLDVKRWSVGLDTGCSYGRRLTALVLGARSFSSGVPDDHSLDFLPEETNRLDAGPFFTGAGEYHEFDSLSDATNHRIKFDHAGEARIFSVKCH
ncbi:Metallo-dependent phosphatase-like protein [Suillus clintonianus]|uniref:Metallo-dependent phosphatase-like protein n=1 Tax=Suillus clintonianus TaxID=1904413 RepID=UPI001B886855|nr:Metallo-dependent phosphatase-like protein [Suillus clintonianus]KAG2131357.1 Metallo-dependent phosphatase-like protein [Suillus clintonianus]